jgi:methionyl aminopeptidase
VIIRKSSHEIDRRAAAGEVVAATIDHVGARLEPGITTGELDRIAEDFIRARGGVPTSKGYRGYPAAIYISPNEVIVHGIPGRRVVSEGDVVTIDVGVTLDGFIADSAYTFGVGEISNTARHLLEVGQRALEEGIAQAHVGNRVGDISAAVQELVERNGLSVVRSLVGHGVGREYHEDPHIPNFGEPGRGPLLSEGLHDALPILITAGSAEVEILDDDWTIRTEDGSLSCHFEHTVAVTADGPRILTASADRAASLLS